jgi:(R,R)-butanediol dehydrogenase / meso-butanediol dehydrogenase / diacetyl reductase
MRVPVFTGLQKLEFAERPEPAAGPGEVVVEVALCGICGSDVHGYLNGIMIPLGTVMGHEAVGTVFEVGEGVNGWSSGDRVAVKPIPQCGECPYCQKGYYSLCPLAFQRAIGISPEHDGAFARLVKVKYPQTMLFRLPDEVSFEEAVLVEPLATSLHGVRLSNLKPGDSAVVIGAGTIGLGVIQFLRVAGAGKIIALEVSAGKRELARQLGADLVLDPVAEGAGARDTILAHTGGLGADVVYECAGVPQALQSSYTFVKSGGQVLLVGINDKEVAIQPFFLSLWEVELKGVLGYYDEFERVIEFLRQGRISVKPMLSAVVSLEEVEEGGFRRLLSCKDDVKIAVQP